MKKTNLRNMKYQKVFNNIEQIRLWKEQGRKDEEKRSIARCEKCKPYQEGMKQTKQDWRGEKGEYYDYGYNDARRKIKQVIKFLKGSVWSNAHDTAWIEQTIKKLQEIK